MCRKSSFTATASLVLLWLSSAATLVFAHCLYSSFLMICENSPDFQGAIFIPAQLMSNGEQPQVCWQLEEMWGCSSIPLCHTTSHLSHTAGQDRDSAKTRWFYHSQQFSDSWHVHLWPQSVMKQGLPSPIQVHDLHADGNDGEGDHVCWHHLCSLIFDVAGEKGCDLAKPRGMKVWSYEAISISVGE